MEVGFARSFALINIEEDSPSISGRWSPLSQSEDFSVLFLCSVEPMYFSDEKSFTDEK